MRMFEVSDVEMALSAKIVFFRENHTINRTKSEVFKKTSIGDNAQRMRNQAYLQNIDLQFTTSTEQSYIHNYFVKCCYLSGQCFAEL